MSERFDCGLAADNICYNEWMGSKGYHRKSLVEQMLRFIQYCHLLKEYSQRMLKA